MNMQPHILIVEDDAEIARLVAAFLGRSGFRTTHLASGKTVATVIAEDPPSLVLLDLLLPGEDGLSIARRIRSTQAIPIIMLTAMSEERDRIRGFDLGADDYVTKPFSAQELVARVRAVLRRSEPQMNGQQGTPVHYSFAGWELDARRRELFDPTTVRVELTTAEFEMLRTFCDHPGTVLGRDQLAKLAQGRRVEPYDRSVDTLISRLRSKIEPEEASPSLIKTVRHNGYVFTPSVVVTIE
jgi:two-component system, OmpR family, response regulator